ncbi:MAG: aminotransferase class V-fold PLP-dependent enzyme [Pseudonocardia sp.]|nr:aminotransferase class V-fold PLP-dependent enzyme [Pseudonocardia sp.]
MEPGAGARGAPGGRRPGRRRPALRRRRPRPRALLCRLADAVGDTWNEGDEIVVSRLDDTANVAPWTWVARRRGVSVRWAEIDIESCELPAWQFDDLLTGGTRVVAVTAVPRPCWSVLRGPDSGRHHVRRSRRPTALAGEV